jgi:NAD(P)-dependent dehydrogenase (short-subunit alcohol dehydrogenase family)
LENLSVARSKVPELAEAESRSVAEKKGGRRRIVEQASVLVTGANRGIGLAISRIATASGENVIAAARRPQSVKIGRALQLDVNNDASVNSAAASLRGVPIDVIINNAGILPAERGPLKADLQHFRDAFETNVLGALRVVRAFLPNLKLARSPRIVNISSREGSISQKRGCDLCSYAVSKAALNSLTRMLAAQLRDICVVAVAPGWVKTRMGGEGAPLTPEASAAAIVKLIAHLTLQDTGKFLDFDGTAIPF